MECHDVSSRTRNGRLFESDEATAAGEKKCDRERERKIRLGRKENRPCVRPRKIKKREGMTKRHTHARISLAGSRRNVAVVVKRKRV